MQDASFAPCLDTDAETGWMEGLGGGAMLWTIAVLLAVLWVIGMVSSYTLGGFIHILLLLAVASILIRVIQGRKPL